ncbi:2444_t:CDS:2, partial [Funneliformis geosporum]
MFPLQRLVKSLQLIKRGEIEPYFDGLQSRKRYAKFWDGVKYDPEVIKFQSSQTSRTGASMMAFSEGLFNGKGPLDTCKSQHIYYWTAPLTLAPIAKRISEEFNISPPLNSSLVPYIFNNCQFWLTVFNRTDAWCSLLSPKELLLSRYYWDIIDYHRLSYGHPLNTRLGCRYLTQLVNGVDDYLNGNSSVIADLKNAHDKYPLTANLTFEQIKEVKYTEYTLIHWSSTLYFEVYTCSDDH